MKSLALLILAFLATAALATAAPASAAPKFDPKIKKCGKIKKAAKKKDCKRKNAATKQAFKEIKDSRFAGPLGGSGVSIDAVFCANGKWWVEAATTAGTNEFSGSRWILSEAFMTAKKKKLALMATGPSNNIFTRVGLQRRGKNWVFSDGNWNLAAPAATKTDATAFCRQL